MADDAIAVRWAEDADVPRLEAFWTQQFGADSVQATPGRIRWLFADQPGGLQTAIAERDGEIVAACGHVVQPVVLPDGRPCDAAFGVDFMVAPEVRRRGLGARLLDLRLDRFPLSLSTGQSDAMAALYRRHDAIDLGGFHEARRCRRLDWNGGARAWLRDVAAWLARVRGPRVSGERSPADPPDIQRAASLDPALDPTWHAWRFDGPVYRDHVTTGLTDGSAWGLLASRREGDAEVLVHLAAPRDQRRRLLAVAASTSTARVVVMHGVGEPLAHDLAAAGFLVRPRAARLVGMTRDAAIARSLRAGAFELQGSAADADLLRRPGR